MGKIRVSRYKPEELMNVQHFYSNHWRVLRYIDEHPGKPLNWRLWRINCQRHPTVFDFEVPWSEDTGTRSAEYLFKCRVGWHDDMDVVKDLANAGFVRIDDLEHGRVVITLMGKELLRTIGAWVRANPKRTWASFRFKSTDQSTGSGRRGDPEGHRESGRAGGSRTLELYGPEHFKRIRNLPRKEE